MKIYKIALTGLHMTGLCLSLGSLPTMSMASSATIAAGGGASSLDFPACPLTKNQMKKVRSVTGYTFKNDRLLASALTHSSLGNSHFKFLEVLGDKMIGTIVGLKVPAATDTAAAFHDAFVAKTTNAYFAERYRMLGLDTLLKSNPSSDLGTIHANALEVLVGAIAEDAGTPPKKPWEIIKILTPIVEKLVWNPIKPVTASVKKAPKAKPPVTAAAAMGTTAVIGTKSAKSTKIKATLIIKLGGSSVVYEQQARGETLEEAKKNVLLGSWKALGFSSEIKKGKRKIAAFEEECRKKGYTFTLA